MLHWKHENELYMEDTRRFSISIVAGTSSRSGWILRDGETPVFTGSIGTCQEEAERLLKTQIKNTEFTIRVLGLRSNKEKVLATIASKADSPQAAILQVSGIDAKALKWATEQDVAIYGLGRHPLNGGLLPYSTSEQKYLQDVTIYGYNVMDPDAYRFVSEQNAQ